MGHRVLAPLHWRLFGDEWVVLLEAAGVVCQLDGFNATVLSLLEDGVADPAEISARIAREAGIENDDILVRKVNQVCDSLSLSGVIEADDS